MIRPVPVAFFQAPPAPSGPAAPANSVLWLSGRRSGVYWQDAARTTPAADGQSVASWYDPAPGATAATQAAAGSQPERDGAAVVFDGFDDWLAIPDAPGLRLAAGFAVEVWVRPHSASGALIISKDTNTPGGREWMVYAGAGFDGFYVFTADGGVHHAPFAPLPLNAWTHLLCAVEPGPIARVYRNSVAQSPVTISGTLATTTTPVNLARWDGFTVGLFAGEVDEVALYQRGPTAADWTTLAADRYAAGLALRS